MGRHLARGRSTSWPMVRRRGTVWACAEDTIQAGTGRLAGWLLNAVIKVVTTYSSPGDRVLLIEPAPGVRRVRGLGPYAGLTEAVWSVVRLGRRVRTQQVGERQPV